MKKIRQRLLSVLLAGLMFLQYLPLQTYADEPVIEDEADEIVVTDPTEIVASGECGAEGDNVLWSLDRNGTMTISGTGKMQWYSHNPGSDPPPWEDYLTDIQTLIVEEGVSYIGSCTFLGTEYLTSVILPESVIEIGTRAFEGCYSLSEITLPSGLTGIGSKTFSGSALTGNLDIPSSVITIEEEAFADCTEITSITFHGITPPEFLYEAEMVFFNMPSLSAIHVPAESYDAYVTALERMEGIDPAMIVAYTPTVIVASGQCGADGDNVLWQLDSDGVFTLSGSGTMKDLFVSHYSNPWKNYFDDIRKVVIEDGITNIGAYAFQTSDTLTEVVIPDSVTVIGEGAFDNCSALTGIELPTSLVTIGDMAFYQSGLTEIELPDSVRKIGFMSFYDCTSLTTAVLNEGLQTIDDGAFALSGLTEIVIPESVTEFGPGDTGVFQECTDLQTAVLPETLASIPSSMFYGCSSLTEIDIPETIDEIGEWAFYGCSSLTEIEIPETVTAIGDWVFADCTAISSIIFRGTVPPEFGENVFKNMSALTAIHVPAESYDAYVEALTGLIDTSLIEAPEPEYQKITGIQIQDIDPRIQTFRLSWNETDLDAGDEYTLRVEILGEDGNYTLHTSELYRSPNIKLKRCTPDADGNLVLRISITKPGSPKETIVAMSDQLVVFTSGFIYSVQTDGSAVITGCFFENAVIPDTIAGYPVTAVAFNDNCSEFLKTLSIPAGITSIENSALDFGSLTKITVAEDNPNYSSTEDGVLFNKDKTEIVIFPRGAYSNAEYVIPDTVTSIPYQCFRLSDVSSVVIPAGLVSIGEGAFIQMYELTEITVAPENCYYSSDEYGVLFNNDKTELICYPYNGAAAEYTVPDGVKVIVEDAFFGCSNLQKVILPEGLTEIGESAWSSSSLKEIVLPSTLTTIGENAFYSSELTGTLTLPEGVSVIGEYAFYRCEELESVIIPASITSIGSYAFAYNDSLTSAYFYGDAPDSVDNGTFIGSSDDFTIYYTEGTSGWTTPTWKGYHTAVFTPAVKVIASGQCGTNITWTLYSDGVLSLDGYGNMKKYIKTFIPEEYRPLAKSLVISDGITSIGNNAFEGCSGLRGELILPDSITSIGTYAFENCSGFTGSLILPDSLTVIMESAFSSCTGFNGNLIFPDSIISIGEYAFENCTEFTGDLVLPDSLTSIGTQAFRNCKSFNGNLVLSESITSIGAEAFSSCSGLTGELILPSSLTVIGARAFEDCYFFESVTVLSDTVTFGSDVFAGTSVTIYGYAGSTAETFAEENNLTFVALEEPVEDVSAPEVLGVYPEAGSTIGLNTAISVKVSDDLEVDTLNVSYSTDNTAWYDLDAVSVGEASAFVTVPLDVSELDGADTVSLQITCTDPAGNTSEALEVSYSIDTVLPEAAALSAQETFSGIVLTWDPINTDDLAGFRIYRKAEGDANYRQIRAFCACQ